MNGLLIIIVDQFRLMQHFVDAGKTIVNTGPCLIDKAFNPGIVYIPVRQIRIAL